MARFQCFSQTEAAALQQLAGSIGLLICLLANLHVAAVLIVEEGLKSRCAAARMWFPSCCALTWGLGA